MPNQSKEDRFSLSFNLVPKGKFGKAGFKRTYFKMNKEKKPSIFIAMPCYDSVKINTMLSIFQLIHTSRHQTKVEVGINTMKSPLIHQARNYLTSVFLTTEYTHLLFIDSDVEFRTGSRTADAGGRQRYYLHPLPSQEPAHLNQPHTYTVKFPDPKVDARFYLEDSSKLKRAPQGSCSFIEESSKKL